MVALATDKLLKVGNPGSATTLSSPGYTIGATSITVGSTSNWSTDTGVAFAIDEAEVVNGVEVQVAGTYNEYVGTVASGTSITNVAWVLGSGDRNYASGALTRVYIPVSAERENRIVEWGLVHADQDGTLKAGAVDNAAVLAIDVVETAKIKDGAVTNAKLSTTAGEIGGAWTTWTPTWSSSGTQPAIGNGTLTGAYMKVGKTINFRFKFVGGSTTTWGTGTYFITLPVNEHADITTNYGIGFTGYAEDLTLQSYYPTGMRMLDASSHKVYVYLAKGSDGVISAWSQSSPFTWGTGDILSGFGTYEAA